VLVGLAEALRAVEAVLDAAAVDAVAVLVVQEQRRHHDHVRAVRHGVAEVAQLAVVAGDHRLRVHAAGGGFWKEEERKVGRGGWKEI